MDIQQQIDQTASKIKEIEERQKDDSFNLKVLKAQLRKWEALRDKAKELAEQRPWWLTTS